MKHKLSIATLLLATSLMTACFKNPVTGRRSLNLVDDATMNSMAIQQYGTFLSSNMLITGTKDAEMVKRVGNRMAGCRSTISK